MAPRANPLEHLSRAELLKLIDGEAQDFWTILKRKRKGIGLPKYYDADTVAVAVVEDKAIGPASRQVVILKQGWRNPDAAPSLKLVPVGEAVTPRDLITQLGPFEQTRDGQRVRFLIKDGHRIEYDGTKVTRVVGPGGAELPESEFARFPIRPNEHHGEMRIEDWSDRTNHRIVAVAPSRGCCEDCLKDLTEYAEKEGIPLDEFISRHRQTKPAWRRFLKEMRRGSATPGAMPPTVPGGAPQPAPGGPSQYVATGEDAAKLARLRNQLRASLTKFKTPDPRLMRIAKFLKVAGPAMMAFDAATTYAKASEQWNHGLKSAAAETVAEFGGRLAGGFVGAEAGALMFGGMGSVVPGLGTTVGALAGMVIGGAVGAWVGEKKAKEFCDQVIAWTKGAHPPDPKPAPAPPKQVPRPGKGPVADLEREMQAAGYGPAEIDFVGRVVGQQMASGAATSPREVFQQVGSRIVDTASSGDRGDRGMMDHYPVMTPDQIQSVEFAQTHRTPPPATPAQRHPGAGPHRPAPPPPHAGAHRGAAPAHRPPVHEPPRFRVEERLTGVVLKRPPGADQPATTSDLTPTATPAVRAEDAGVQSVGITDLSGRIDSLRTRIDEYQPLVAGRSDAALESQLETDRKELRKIQDQLRLSGASALELHAVEMRLNEVRNRYEQTADDARWAQDRKDEVAQKADDAKRQAEEDARRRGPPNDARDATGRRNEDQGLREVQERQQREERERREQERRNEQKTKEQAEDDARRRRDADDARARADAAAERLRRDEDARRQADAARRRAEDDARRAQQQKDELAKKADDAKRQAEEEARRRAPPNDARDATGRRGEDQGLRELQDRQQREERERREQERRNEQKTKEQAEDAARRGRDEADARTRVDAERLRREEDARRQADDARRRTEDDARRQADAARRRAEDDARLKVEGVRLQRDDGDARPQADAARRQRDEDEARRQADAARRQRDEDEARRQADAARRQRQEDEARLKVQGVRLQRDDGDARRQADAVRRQREEEEARRQADAARRQREEEAARRQADAVRRQRQEEEARRQADAARRQHQEEAARRQADAARRQREEEEARRQADAALRQQERLRNEAEQAQKQRDRALQQAAAQAAHAARQRAIEEERSRKQWEQQRRQAERDAQQRQREQDHLRKEAERAQKQRDRDLRQAEYAARQRAIEDDRRRKDWERQRRQAERDAIQRQRDEERRRREYEQQQRQAERDRKQREREAHQRDRDARRNQRTWTTTRVSGSILWGGKGKRR